MLPVVLVLSGCVEGKYYSHELLNCYTPKECEEEGGHVYKMMNLCMGYHIPNRARNMTPDEDGVFACPKNMYTVFRGTSAECISSLEDCDGMYTIANKAACTDNKTICRTFLRYTIYNASGRAECIPDCYSRNGYGYGYYYCVTADQCSLAGFHIYVTKSVRNCLRNSPAEDGDFDPEKQETGVYTCPNKLLDTTKNTYRCTANNSCSDVVVESSATCVTTSYCKQ